VTVVRALLLAGAAALLASCSGQTRSEREAERITQAVMANNLQPVESDIGKGIAITRVQVAEWSDELNNQGKLLSVKETTTDCSPGWHCLDVKFEKREYVERMRFDENGKVVNWNFHMAPK
jgi:hypothetical protein